MAQSATSLAAAGGKASDYTAASYDELVDSPIIIGNIRMHEFVVRSGPGFPNW